MQQVPVPVLLCSGGIGSNAFYIKGNKKGATNGWLPDSGRCRQHKTPAANL